MKVKSEAQKRVEGTNRNDRKVSTTSNTTKVPVPPKALKLDAEEKKIYKELGKHLLSSDAAYKIDGYVLGMCARSITLMSKYSYEVANGKAIQKFKSGAVNVSVEFTLLKYFEKQFLEYSKLLGLSLKDREKILCFLNEKGVDDDDDPFLALLNKQRKTNYPMLN